MTLFDLVLAFVLGTTIFEYLIRIPINYVILNRIRKKAKARAQAQYDHWSDAYYNSDVYYTKPKKTDLH